MSEVIINKENILNNILLKAFGNSLNHLEKRTTEEMDALTMISKQFKVFNKNINDLIINVNITKEKLKSNQKNNIQQTKKTILSRSKTQNNYYSHNKIHSQITTKRNLKANLKGLLIPKSKTIQNSQNTSFENKLIQPINKYQNKKSRNILVKTKTNTETFIKKNNNPKINNSMTTPRHNKNYKKTLEIKADLFDIQETIKKVENTISNTEKLVHKKNISVQNITYTKNKFLKNNFNLNKKSTFKKKKLNLEPYLKEMNEILIDKIFNYCDTNEKFNLIQSNKKLFIYNHYNYLQSLIKKLNYNYNDEINKLKEKYKEEIENDYPEFSLAKSTIKAIKLLNDEIYCNIFYREELSGKYLEIIIVYKILCQLLKKEDLINIKDNNKFWEKICLWLIEEGNKGLGDYLINKSKEFIFDDENIYKIEKIIKNNKSNFNPSYYSNICGTTGLIVFLLKDALEYAGIIINEKKISPKRLLNNVKYQFKIKIDALKGFQKRLKIEGNNINEFVNNTNIDNKINNNDIKNNDKKINNFDSNQIISISKDNLTSESDNVNNKK